MASDLSTRRLSAGSANALGTTAHTGAALLAPHAARLTLVLLGIRQFVQSGATVGDLAAVLLAPVWLWALPRYRGARALAVLGAVTLAWGLVLREIASADHKINSTVQTSSTVLLAGVLMGAFVIAWARTLLTLNEVAFWYGVGMIVRALLDGPGDNPWKNTFAIPLAIVLLGFVGMRTRDGSRGAALLGAVSLTALAAVSAFSDSRSYAATFLITAILLLWQARPTRMSGRASAGATVLMLGGLAGAIYWLGSRLLVSGYLGADAQARTIEQIDQSGSLILGGRPELQATIALMRYRIGGYGAGVEPNGTDILIAKTGLKSINYNPNNGYVEKFMFGGHIELHSVFGDLWASWGIPGLVLLGFFGFFLIHNIARSVTDRRAKAAVLFLSIWTLWNLFFSPIYGSAPTLTLGVGLALIATRRRAPSAATAS